MNKSIVLQSPQVLKVLDLVDDWHDHLDLLVRTGELSANSRDLYKRGWGRFQDWLMNQDVNQVDADDIRLWMAELKEKGYKPNTVNAWLAGVRSLFKWAVGNRRLPLNPTEGVKTASRNGGKKHKRDALTNPEVKRVLDQPDRSTAQGKRDLAILYLKAYTAIRDIEIHRADLEDLQTSSNHLVLYYQGKGHEEKDDVKVIDRAEAQEALFDWLAARGDDPGPLFISLSNRAKNERLSLRSIRRMVKGYYKSAGVRGKKKTSHSLRHSAITNMINGGAPPHKAQSVAGHTNLNTTLGYYHELDRIEDPGESYINYDR